MSLRETPCRVLGERRVNTVTTGNVMAVLLPIWSTKRETARRLRHRIGALMKCAMAQGYCTDNPAGDALSAPPPKNGVRIEHGKAYRTSRSVSLSSRVLAVLGEAFEMADGGRPVFPSATGRTLCQCGMPQLLHQLDVDAVPAGAPRVAAGALLPCSATMHEVRSALSPRHRPQ